ncbi:uncharacterized protein LOC114181453 [Vigna unguiculata]|nr:uncharacterized protein LOC114181453 [Vigna unguiculata]
MNPNKSRNDGMATSNVKDSSIVPSSQHGNQMEGQPNNLENELTKMLQNVPLPNIQNVDEQCIYRVPPNTRKRYPVSYIPRIVGIGPYHRKGSYHRKESDHLNHLKVSYHPEDAENRLKLKYVQAFLSRTKLSVGELVGKIEHMRTNIESIRSCYAQTFEYKDDVFFRIILVDALFIIELFLRWHEDTEEKKKDDTKSEGHTKSKDHTVLKPWKRQLIRHDLVLLENQLPFSVLQQLYDNCVPNIKKPVHHATGEPVPDTVDEPLPGTPCFFKICVNCICTGTNCFNRIPTPSNGTPAATNQIISFLQLSFNCLHSTSFQTECPRETPRHFTDLLRSSIISSSTIDIQNPIKGQKDVNHVYTASQLMEAGLKFKVSPNKSFLDLTYIDGVLSMPVLNINGSTEIFFRNMMAYEYYHHSATKVLIQYVTILNFLIHTEKDVNILIDNKIILNWTGDAKTVVTIINHLNSSFSMPDFIPHYFSICNSLNKFYENPCNKLKASLRQGYFNTPWKKLSTCTAVLLVFLALAQTTFSAISLAKKL